ncbi:MAG: type II secretion system F family protein, partial [Acidobacteriaceae bacterium]
VPISESIDTVASASGNAVYRIATESIGKELLSGTSIRVAMSSTKVFPILFLQYAQIGEETGKLGAMLTKAAEFYEQEVDEITKNLSSLLEPIIISVLGVVVGGLVVSLYLPIFELGKVVH